MPEQSREVVVVLSHGRERRSRQTRQEDPEVTEDQGRILGIAGECKSGGSIF